MVDFNEVKRIMEMKEETNNELLVIYNKDNQNVIIPLVKMFTNTNGMIYRLLSRDIIIDTIGSQYNVLYSSDTKMEEIINQLEIEIMGKEINKSLENQNDEPIPDLQSNISIQ